VSAGTTTCATPPPNCNAPCDVSQYQFADIDPAPVTPTSLTGSVSGTPATISLSGCWQDGDGALRNVYIRAKINAYTGIGIGNLYPNMSDQTACINGTTTGITPWFVKISAVRQAPGPEPSTCTATSGPCRDSDGDGCSDKNELGTIPGAGGLRDPFNRWDYFNTAGNPHQIRIDDILKVEHQFFIDAPTANYTTTTDRTALLGGNVWNLGPPNGQQRVDDITAVTKQFFHDCW
jgi:hypothetical protein